MTATKTLHPLLLPGEGVTEALERQAAKIERLTRERDEWKEKWIALAPAALILGGKPEGE
jgi:hypothetical protein